MKLPDRFVIPEDRIPKPWSQGVYNCCVAASVTKVLEVINYIKTGKYTMFSKGYTYGRHSRPDKTQGGMDYEYLMGSLLQHGTIPEEMFPYLNEIPDIIEDITEHPNIFLFDKEAEKTKIKSFQKIVGNVYFLENVKKLLYDKQMPLVGNMVGKRHCTVIVGWDRDKLLYQNHDGRDTLTKGEFNEAYYLDGGIEMPDKNSKLPFEDVKETDWFYEDVKFAFDKGLMYGTRANIFEPNKPLTRAEISTIIHRVIKYIGGM